MLLRSSHKDERTRIETLMPLLLLQPIQHATRNDVTKESLQGLLTPQEAEGPLVHLVTHEQEALRQIETPQHGKANYSRW